MEKLIAPPKFNHKQHLYILKTLVIAANALALFGFAFLHFIFYDMPFVFRDEMIFLLNAVAWATGIAVVTSFALFAGDGLAYLIRYRKQFKFQNIFQVTKAVPSGNGY